MSERRESDQAEAGIISRRGFLGGVSAIAAAAAVVGPSAAADAGAAGPGTPLANVAARRRRANSLRVSAARRHLLAPLTVQATNGDEARYGDFRASYSKGLPHNALGEVDPAAFAALQVAGNATNGAGYELIPLGGARKQVSPQACLSYELSGIDGQDTRIAPPPTFASADQATEMLEVYWQALTRDVPYRVYDLDSTVADAVDELNAVSVRIGTGATVTPGNLFRGETPGDLIGPYISQFLWLPVPYGPTRIDQRYAQPNPEDFMTSYGEWLAIQNGVNPTRTLTFGPGVYIHDNRTLGEWVRVDVSFQGPLNAALICLGFGGAALSPTNPYRSLAKQAAFANFGGPEILHLVTMSARAALVGAWFQKWSCHRWLRPEAFAGRVHNQVTGVKDYGIHPDATSSEAVLRLLSANGTALLPLAFPEGSPTHPSFPAGHAAIAGAGSTMLKALFDENFVIPNPVEASADGSTLDPYAGTLTLGNEFNKLAANIAIGRDAAGVHYRADGVDGMALGEQIAIGILQDYSVTHSEEFAGFRFTRFDGVRIQIRNGAVSIL